MCVYIYIAFGGLANRSSGFRGLGFGGLGLCLGMFRA